MTAESGNLERGGLSPRGIGSIGPTAERGRVRLRTLIAIRWIAALGQASALLVTYFALDYEFPLVLALAVVGSSVVVNILATVGRRATERLSDRVTAIYLAFDLIQLGALLFLTGGLHNPFALLILAPVTVSATILSRFSTVALSALGVLILVLLASYHLPLPWKDSAFILEPLFVTGLAIALGLSVVFIAGYVFSVAEEARRMSAALSASYMALDREQRLSSLGALAAAAAHRLGSPLGTIAVVARELARDLPADNPMRRDVELLLSETERCREILTELSTRPESTVPLERLPMAALVETAALPYRSARVRLTVTAAPFSPGADKLGTPAVPPSPALLHGLGNLLQNAMEFARSEVRVLVGWDDRQVMVTIKDDGPGFAPGVLDHLGEPYMSGGLQGRDTSGEPMGLGVFISQTLLEQTDARLHFANGANGGGEVTVTWDRTRLQRDAA